MKKAKIIVIIISVILLIGGGGLGIGAYTEYATNKLYEAKYSEEIRDKVLNSKLDETIKEHFIIAVESMPDNLNEMKVKDLITLGEDRSRTIDALVSDEYVGMEYFPFISDCAKDYEDKEIWTLYRYWFARTYMDVDGRYSDVGYALREIEPTYSGAYSEQVYNLAVEYFGSEEEWIKQHENTVEEMFRDIVSQRTESNIDRAIYERMRDRYIAAGTYPSDDDYIWEYITDNLRKYNSRLTPEIAHEIWVFFSFLDKEASPVTLQDTIVFSELDYLHLYYNNSPKVDRLIEVGDIYQIPAYTPVSIIGQDYNYLNITILDGEYEGETGWVLEPNIGKALSNK